MTGYLHIFRSDVATGTFGRPYTEYQLTYSSGRHSWARAFEEQELEEFLVQDVALAPEYASQIMDRLRLHGNVTVPDISLPEEEADAMGFQQMPSDI